MIAVSKKKKFKVKRLGTKKIKAIELEAKAGEILTGERATEYRALSARINVLASDRPDIAYAAKELCRDFASPTQKSIEKLKRCVRYLCHTPSWSGITITNLSVKISPYASTRTLRDAK